MQKTGSFEDEVLLVLDDWMADDCEDFLKLRKSLKRVLRAQAKRMALVDSAQPVMFEGEKHEHRQANSLAEIYADDALSKNVWERALSDPSIYDFRTRYLHGITVEDSGLEAALLSLHEADRQLPGARLSNDHLPYITHSRKDRDAPSIQIHSVGALRELYHMCLGIGRRYRFSLSQAVGFVMCASTRYVPLLMGASIRFEGRHDIPELSRIILTVHPRTSVREVADLYNRWRFEDRA